MLKRLVLALALLSCLFFATGCSTNPAASSHNGDDASTENSSHSNQQETIRIGVLQIADSFPLYVASAEGLFEQHKDA